MPTAWTPETRIRSDTTETVKEPMLRGPIKWRTVAGYAVVLAILGLPIGASYADKLTES